MCEGWSYKNKYLTSDLEGSVIWGGWFEVSSPALLENCHTSFFTCQEQQPAFLRERGNPSPDQAVRRGEGIAIFYVVCIIFLLLWNGLPRPLWRQTIQIHDLAVSGRG